MNLYASKVWLDATTTKRVTSVLFASLRPHSDQMERPNWITGHSWGEGKERGKERGKKEEGKEERVKILAPPPMENAAWDN